MSDPHSRSGWAGLALYPLLAGAILFGLLLPLRTAPSGLAGPDLLVALSFALILIRPDLVPSLILFAVLLLADFLLMRPPGLWAGLVLMGCEWLRRRHLLLGADTFLARWLSVAVLLFAITLAYRLIQALLFVPSEPFVLLWMKYAMTVLVFPLINGLCWMMAGAGRGGFEQSGGGL